MVRSKKAAVRASPRTDPYIKRSKALWQIHDAMPEWLWKACNEELDACDALLASPPTHNQTQGKKAPKTKAQFDTDKKREAALSLALALPLSKSKVCATRPSDPLPSSPAMDALRDVLSEAPCLPQTAGMHVEGLHVEQRPSATDRAVAVYLYEWDGA